MRISDWSSDVCSSDLWFSQFEQSQTRDLPRIREVHDALAARIPEQGPAAIVHGDYRLDNCMTNDDGEVIAVLDWEICTLGDPLADVGLLMVYWTEADDAYGALRSEEHTSELQSLMRNSYDVFCLKKKTKHT